MPLPNVGRGTARWFLVGYLVSVGVGVVSLGSAALVCEVRRTFNSAQQCKAEDLAATEAEVALVGVFTSVLAAVFFFKPGEKP